MSYSGLGQAPAGSALITLAPRSDDLITVQRRLIDAGLLRLSAPDGVISSTSSPTLTAIRSFATNNGLSATGTARSSTGGLVIPRSLFSAIIAAGGADMDFSETITSIATGPAPTTTPAPMPGSGPTALPSKGGAASPGMPSPGLPSRLPMPSTGADPRTILIVSGVGVLLLAGLAVWMTSRPVAAPVRANRRRRR